MALMDAPDEVTGPVNLGNPSEITIPELAEKIVHLLHRPLGLTHTGQMHLALLVGLLELGHKLLEALLLGLESGALFRHIENPLLDLLKEVVKLLEPRLYAIDIFFAPLKLVDFQVRLLDEILERLEALFHPIDFAVPFELLLDFVVQVDDARR